MSPFWHPSRDIPTSRQGYSWTVPNSSRRRFATARTHTHVRPRRPVGVNTLSSLVHCRVRCLPACLSVLLWRVTRVSPILEGERGVQIRCSGADSLESRVARPSIRQCFVSGRKGEYCGILGNLCVLYPLILRARRYALFAAIAALANTWVGSSDGAVVLDSFSSSSPGGWYRWSQQLCKYSKCSIEKVSTCFSLIYVTRENVSSLS